MENLDIDAPHEVVARAGHFTATASDLGTQVVQATSGLQPHHRPESSLDHALVAKTRWIETTFDNAVTASARRADATLRHTTHVAQALGHGDVSGGTEIDRYRSI
ncbi:hypothetical protein [Nocardia sp. NPDC052112]|uniref:hypothetical protein n=1 Tax=Nocardia sp. NPDC052112 TaxID=3155646 RepID=UPI003428BC0D